MEDGEAGVTQPQMNGMNTDERIAPQAFDPNHKSKRRRHACPCEGRGLR